MENQNLIPDYRSKKFVNYILIIFYLFILLVNYSFVCFLIYLFVHLHNYKLLYFLPDSSSRNEDFSKTSPVPHIHYKRNNTFMVGIFTGSTLAHKIFIWKTLRTSYNRFYRFELQSHRRFDKQYISEYISNAGELVRGQLVDRILEKKQ